MQCNGFIILKYLANIASLYEDDLYTKLEKYERKSIEQNNQIIFFTKRTPCYFQIASFSCVNNLCLKYKHWVENHYVKTYYPLWICNNSKCNN